jgi:hypothetical protein
MARQLIVISPPGERLSVEPSQGTVRSVPAPGDDYTHLIIEAAGAGSAPGSPPPEPKGEEPPPVFPITMSLVGGLPPELAPWRLTRAPRITGPVSVSDLARRLAQAPADDGPEILVLGSGHGR